MQRLRRVSLPTMIAKNYGRIVNISSITSLRQSVFGGIDYTASKWAVRGITNHLAWEVGPHNITVNAVCPGGVQTSVANEATMATMRKIAARMVPLGHKVTSIQDIADATLYFAGDRSPMITGLSMPVSGGTELGYGEDIRAMTEQSRLGTGGDLPH